MSISQGGPTMHDILMPMHLGLSSDGTIRHAGPAIAKLRQPRDLLGHNVLEVFRLRRPRCTAGFSALRARAPVSAVLKFADPPETGFKAVLVENEAEEGFLLNLSFGLSIVAAIADYNLSAADFAPTDLAVELLYLNEAKSAMMEELRRLNIRLRAARIAAEEQAFTDTLTGLKNRRALGHVLDRYTRRRQTIGLLHLDLDLFKRVNDTHGHAAGDYVLQEVARRIVEQCRTGDTVARVGGDEFLVVLPDLTDGVALSILGWRLVQAIEQPIVYRGLVCRLSASAGAAIESCEYGVAYDELIARADAALYRSKREGRGQFSLWHKNHFAG